LCSIFQVLRPNQLRAVCEWLVRTLALFSLLNVCGCSYKNRTHSVAQNLTSAAADAALHPMTWAPLSAGLIFITTGGDEIVSDWAADHRPLFGRTDRAADVSDILLDSLRTGMFVSSIAAPLPVTDEQENAHGIRHMANNLAFQTNRYSTAELKVAFGRERPNKGNNLSLPSGHTSASFTAAASIEQNLAFADLAANDRFALKLGLYGLAGTTAWARLEARKHFPSDVFFGAALGNFLSRLVLGTLFGSSSEPPMAIEGGRDQMVFRLRHAL